MSEVSDELVARKTLRVKGQQRLRRDGKKEGAGA
jgi:hypothetical protein